MLHQSIFVAILYICFSAFYIFCLHFVLFLFGNLIKTFLCLYRQTETTHNRANVWEFFKCFKPLVATLPKVAANNLKDRESGI